MNPFEFVIALVFMCLVFGLASNLIKSRSRHNDKSESYPGEADELRDQILTLEERIRVLERIVTDSNGREDLRRQFRDLERE